MGGVNLPRLVRQTDMKSEICQNLGIESSSCPRIEHPHAIDDGVLVYFDDGKVALFSAALLRSILPDAVEIMIASEEE